MLGVNTLNSSIGITVKNTGDVETLASVLMSNGYWIKIEPKGKDVMIWVKEDKNNGN